MLRYLFLIVVIVFFVNAFSQSKKSSISLYTSVLNDNENYAPKIDLTNNETKETSFFFVGTEYSCKLKNKWSLNGGIEFTHHKITVVRSGPGDPPYIPYPSDDHGEYDLLSFPLSARYSFLKYFFVQGGISIDIQTKNIIYGKSSDQNDAVNNQSGIGSIIALGTQYSFAKHFSVFAAANNELHGLILFKKEFPYRKFGDIGLRTGLSYQF